MRMMILIATVPVVDNTFTDYLIGGLISFFIMCYLVYSLVKPEKF
jgi:K+-transporting ATPase KdpF subunit